MTTFNASQPSGLGDEPIEAYAAFYGPNLYQVSELGRYPITNATYVASNYLYLKSSYEIISGSQYNLGYVISTCFYHIII